MKRVVARCHRPPGQGREDDSSVLPYGPDLDASLELAPRGEPEAPHLALVALHGLDVDPVLADEQITSRARVGCVDAPRID